MLSEFRRQWVQARPAERDPRSESLTIGQVVTLASLVEREARSVEEMPSIAAVYLNRLARGMRLQCCATVRYSLGEVWDRPLTYADLEIDHPYNTYLHEGLPPGPIANPGRPAIEAVLRPAETNDLFYVYDGQGGHIFSRTHREHRRAAAEARKRRPEATVIEQSVQ
jgi:UPF0755 protein